MHQAFRDQVIEVKTLGNTQRQTRKSSVLTSYLSGDIGTYIWPVSSMIKQYVTANVVSGKLSLSLVEYISRYFSSDFEGRIIVTANMRIPYSKVKSRIGYLAFDASLKILHIYMPHIFRRHNRSSIRSLLIAFLLANSRNVPDTILTIGSSSVICKRDRCGTLKILPVIVVFSRQRIKPPHIDLEKVFDDVSNTLKSNGFDEFINSLGYRGYSLVGSRTLIYNIVIKDRSRDYIEINIREGIENIKVKIDLKKPEWDLSVFPRRLVEDLETLIVNPIKSGALYAPKGAIIIGPPGVGKSVLANAIANSIGLRIVDVKPSIYRSMWYGMTEKILDKLLNRLLRMSNVAVVIDDAEFLLNRSSSIHEVHVSEISLLLKYLQEPNKPMTILTSNMPNLIDPAILRPGRIDVAIVLGYPDREFRRLIISYTLNKLGIDPGSVGDSVFEELVYKTRWFNSAEIDSFIRMALARGGGKITSEAVEWARRKINIDPYNRESEQRFLRWSVSQFSNIVISYIPDERMI